MSTLFSGVYWTLLSWVHCTLCSRVHCWSEYIAELSTSLNWVRVEKKALKVNLIYRNQSEQNWFASVVAPSVYSLGWFGLKKCSGKKTAVGEVSDLEYYLDKRHCWGIISWRKKPGVWEIELMKDYIVSPWCKNAAFSYLPLVLGHRQLVELLTVMEFSMTLHATRIWVRFHSDIMMMVSLKVTRTLCLTPVLAGMGDYVASFIITKVWLSDLHDLNEGEKMTSIWRLGYRGRFWKLWYQHFDRWRYSCEIKRMGTLYSSVRIGKLKKNYEMR